MTAIDKPIFVVAIRDEWAGVDEGPDNSLPCFGTLEDARGFAAEFAESQGVPVSAMRIVEYRFSGNVTEG